MEKIRFIVVAENIHCTLIRKVGGPFARETADGKGEVLYKDLQGKERSFPVPPAFKASADWENGKVKHVAAAMWQGYYGEGAAKEEGIEYLRHWARLQESQGGDFLDLNVDEFSTNLDERIGLIKWAGKIVQDASKLPLSVDSSNIEIIEAGLSVCDSSRGKPMVNSVSLERKEAIALAKKAGAVVIAGATGENSMPNTVDERVANCESLMKILKSEGFKEADVYFDPLVFPISVDKTNGMAIIDTVKALRKMYGKDIHFAPGLSNISYGLPKRPLINTVFSYVCAKEGMDGGIVDPKHINEKALNSMDTSSEAYKLAEDLVLGKDDWGMNYITASRDGIL